MAQATSMDFGKLLRERYLQNVPGELVGGLIAAVVALPLALAFGEASGLGAQAGLYGAIACGFFAAMLGGTGGQVSGPTGPMTVVAAGLVAMHINQPELVIWAVILAGLIQVALGIFRLGQYVYYIPYPVVSGFMSGIGVIIIGIQIGPLMGYPGKGDVLESLQELPNAIAGLNEMALLCGVASLVIIYLFPKITKAIPSSLVALVAITLLSVWQGWDIPRIGDVPTGMPQLALPGLHHLADIHLILTAAITLALLGALDSLMTSIIVDRMTGAHHNSDQELIGQGIGNTMSGLIGGLPGAGATMRSVVNIKANGRFYLSGMVHSLVLLGVLMGLGGLVSVIPLAVLAGILISVGISIIDYRGLKSIPRCQKSDTAELLTVLVLTVFSDLIVAVGVGIIMASVLFVKKLSDSRLSEHGNLASTAEKHYNHVLEVEGIPKDLHDTVYVYQFNGPLFFGEVKNFTQTMPSMYKYHYIILHFADVPVIDQSGVMALEDSIRQLRAKNIKVLVVNMDTPVLRTYLQAGVRDLLEPEHQYQNIADAVAWIREKYDFSGEHKEAASAGK